VLGGKEETEERLIISSTLDAIENSTGQRPLGWLSPALQETFNTPDILSELGVKYLCDWCCDDQPFPMKVKKGTMISVPYSLELNDIPAFIDQNLTPPQFCEMIIDQFDTLYKDGAETARVMCIALHPFLIGQPFRIGWLDKALQHIRSHENVWFARGRDIAAWYYEKYLGFEFP
jgi:peptidoglycan/xylan/chitin deacetylase (PgdA/CDA1 family)